MSELFLRLGCALTGWILIFAHALLLAIVPLADCSADLWRVTLLFAGLALAGGGLVGAGLPWRSSLRWLALLALPLWVRGLAVAIGVWRASGGAPLCDALHDAARVATTGSPIPVWERAWAPVQIAAIGWCAVQAARHWRPN